MSFDSSSAIYVYVSKHVLVINYANNYRKKQTNMDNINQKGLL